MSKESAYFVVPDIGDGYGAEELEKELSSVSGILSVNVNSQQNRIEVDYDSEDTDEYDIERKIKDLGYDVSLDDETSYWV